MPLVMSHVGSLWTSLIFRFPYCSLDLLAGLHDSTAEPTFSATHESRSTSPECEILCFPTKRAFFHAKPLQTDQQKLTRRTKAIAQSRACTHRSGMDATGIAF